MKIVLVGGTSELNEWIQRLVGEGAGTAEIVRITGRLPELAAAIERELPQVAIADVRGIVPTDLDSLRHVTLRNPETSVVLITEDTNSDFLLHALRVGVREVLSAPASEEGLRQAFVRLRERQSASRRRDATILSVMSAKGGSGGTFLAANLAYALALQGRQVAFIDLNLQFGDAVLFVSEGTPGFTIADVARQVQRLDASFLAASMVEVLPNCHVLAAPESPEDALEVNEAALRAILDVARKNYDVVVIDVGRSLNATSVFALDQSTAVYVVLQLTLPFLRDAKRLMAAFRTLDYAADKIHLVVNRYQRGGDLDLGHVQKTLGLEIDRTIPNSFSAVAASINHGVPILKHAPRDAVAVALQEWAQELAPSDSPVLVARNWFRSLVGAKS